MQSTSIAGTSTDNARKALNLFADVGRVTDRELGAMLGKSRQTGLAKRHGVSDISLDDIDAFAAGLDVQPTVFLMELADVQRWIQKHDWRGPRRTIDLRGTSSSCDAPEWVIEPTLWDDQELFEPSEVADEYQREAEPIGLYADVA